MNPSHTARIAIPNPKTWLLGLAILSTATFCYWGIFRALADQWWNNDMYSYGYLIPVISLYLVWVRRDQLVSAGMHPSLRTGIPVFLVGLLLLLVGYAGSVIVLQEISLLITITGAVLLLLGISALRVLWLPIAYLLFMIPIWGFATDRLHFPFQMFSATLGVNLLQLIGIPAFQQGTHIELPNVTLEVAKACSGVNYLIAVIAIGVPLAYLYLRGWLVRIALVTIAVGIAALSNSLRVTLIGALSYYGIGGSIHGPLHVLQGLSVSIVGYVALFAGLSGLSRFFPTSAKSDETIPRSPAMRLDGPAIGFPAAAAAAAALFLIIGLFIHFHRPSQTPLRADLIQLPEQIGAWEGRDVPADDPVYTMMGADHQLSRVYETPSGNQLRLYIGYAESQYQGKELINYQTAPLHEASSERTIDLGGRRLTVNQFLDRRDRRTDVFLYWYDINGRMVSDRIRAKAYTALDFLTRARNNGAVIIITIPLPDQGELSGVLRESENFIRDALPYIREILPL